MVFSEKSLYVAWCLHILWAVGCELDRFCKTNISNCCSSN